MDAVIKSCFHVVFEIFKVWHRLPAINTLNKGFFHTFMRWKKVSLFWFRVISPNFFIIFKLLALFIHLFDIQLLKEPLLREFLYFLNRWRRYWLHHNYRKWQTRNLYFFLFWISGQRVVLFFRIGQRDWQFLLFSEPWEASFGIPPMNNSVDMMRFSGFFFCTIFFSIRSTVIFLSNQMIVKNMISVQNFEDWLFFVEGDYCIKLFKVS